MEKKIDLRNIMSAQPADERIKNFNEVALGFDDETAKNEAARCIQCKNAPCMKGCPVGINIPGFIKNVRDGDIDAAVSALKADNNLPAVCGRVCPQETQCEELCIRKNKLGGSVAIGALERYVADYCLRCGVSSEKPKSNGKKAAVIGSGPAGLTAAADLAMAGFEVTVYESLHKPGGVLVYGIPEFRLPKAIVQKEIDLLKALGVEIKLNVLIGKTITLEELRRDNFAVFIATGAGLPSFLNIKGENLNGVYSANEYLTRVNLMKAYKDDSATPVIKGSNVVVVGAGNVAMDAARTARRLGANVNLVYRRTRAEMPARHEEIEHAEEEGIVFSLLTNPVEILGADGWVSGVKCIKMELGEPDSSGRRRPVAIAGSEHVVPCDMVVVSLGTTPNPLLKNSCPALETSKWGTIIVDDNGETSLENVFAGGDAVTGAATVILAMGAGKTAAAEIIRRSKNS